MPERQAERLAAEVSQDFDAFYVSREADGPEVTLNLLVIRDMLYYNDYMAPGLVIATGVIEGTRRRLLKDRIEVRAGA